MARAELKCSVTTEPEPRPLAIELPAHERGRAADDLKRLDRLNARLAKPGLAPEKREDILREREGLESRPQIAAEREWRDQSTAETIALAQARGEDAQRLPSGALRVNNRDAIASIAHKLTEDQTASAYDCRGYYEARSEGLGSQMGGLGSVGQPGYDNSPAVFNGLQRAKKLQRIATIERAIAMDPKCRAEPASMQIFRAICCDNKPLSVWGEGRALDRNLKAFVLALDVADAVIRGR